MSGVKNPTAAEARMKKYSILTFLAALMWLSTVAFAAQWQLYSETKYGEKYYIDTESTTTSAEGALISIKSEAVTTEAVSRRIRNLELRNAPTEGYEDYSYRIQQCEIRCSAKEWRPLSFTDYNHKGVALGADTKPAESVAITTDTIIDYYYKKLCNK